MRLLLRLLLLIFLATALAPISASFPDRGEDPAAPSVGLALTWSLHEDISQGL